MWYNCNDFSCSHECQLLDNAGVCLKYVITRKKYNIHMQFTSNHNLLCNTCIHPIKVALVPSMQYNHISPGARIHNLFCLLQTCPVYYILGEVLNYFSETNCNTLIQYAHIWTDLNCMGNAWMEEELSLVDT